MPDDGEDFLNDMSEMLDAAGDIADGVSNFMDEHEDSIRSISGDVDGVDLGDDSALKSARTMENKVEVVVEADIGGKDKVGLEERDGDLIIHLGDGKMGVSVPEDCEIDKADAMYNNGILTVEIPLNGD